MTANCTAHFNTKCIIHYMVRDSLQSKVYTNRTPLTFKYRYSYNGVGRYVTRTIRWPLTWHTQLAQPSRQRCSEPKPFASHQREHCQARLCDDTYNGGVEACVRYCARNSHKKYASCCIIQHRFSSWTQHRKWKANSAKQRPRPCFFFIERNNQIYYICLRLLLRREIPYVSKLVAVVMEWRWTGGVGEMGGDAVTSIRPSSSV